MLALGALIAGLAIGFIFGWLVRDEKSRPLRREGFGLGVPGEWVQDQRRGPAPRENGTIASD